MKNYTPKGRGISQNGIKRLIFRLWQLFRKSVSPVLLQRNYAVLIGTLSDSITPGIQEKNHI